MVRPEGAADTQIKAAEYLRCATFSRRLLSPKDRTPSVSASISERVSA